MAEIKKFLDSDGLTYFCKKFQDYPSNEILGAVINAIDNTKVDKVEGKDLSTNDYTNEDKNKLDSSITFNEQNLSDEQQAQARANINSPSKVDIAQIKEAEALRSAAETDRANAESGRVSAEQGRVSAESERVAAEKARAKEFAGFSVEITQLKDDLTDFKDGFSRLNLFKEAELYAENSYVNIKDGKLNPSSNSAYDIYIISVDGISKYTANKLVTFSLPLAADKITATNPSLLSRLTQFDTSLYDGTKYLALSVLKTEAPTFAISKGDIATDSVDLPEWYKKDTDFIKQKINSSCVTFEVETDTMSSGDSLIACERLDISKNTVEEFFANVVSFDSLTIGHGGATRFMGSEIVINSTNVLIKSYNDKVLKNVEHNLTISDFIFVLLEKDDKTRCKVTLITNGGTFVTETNSAGGFYAVNGNIFATTTSELSNATLKFMAKDINADTWVFGDSYITLNDSNKYMT